MTMRFITDEELAIATTMVSEAMLRALPEPEECTGQFTAQFEEKIEKLKKTAVRKANWRKFAKSAVAAILVVLIGFSMLCAFNTEVRAAVVTWFKETFETYSTYWFTSEEQTELPVYELTWIPDGYELIREDSYGQMYGAVYLRESNIMDGFTFDYSIADNDTQMTIQSHYGQHHSNSVNIGVNYGELYLSDNVNEANALIWFDEEHSIMFSITSYMDSETILQIASNVKLAD